MLPLHIVADENIPLVSDLFGSLGPVRMLSGRDITPEMVRDAEVLLVRSVTRVDAALLDGSAVRFVGSATSGLDHIDAGYLRQRGIPFAYAPGSNADSVVEYVLATLFCLAVNRGEALGGKTLGIVGCGRIGSRLAARAAALGMKALLCDPPLAEADDPAGTARNYLPLDTLIEQADILTFHVPLVREGPHPTWHMIGRGELAALRPGAWLINTSRGAVFDNEALLETLQHAGRRPAAVALDVWEGEPVPSAALLRCVDIATPHIAGYSYDGKVAGAYMLRDAMASLPGMNVPVAEGVAGEAGGGAEPLLCCAPDPVLPETDWLHHLVRSMYDVWRDDRRMRGSWPDSDEAAALRFTHLRRMYPRRRAFSLRRLDLGHVPDALHRAVREGLGVQIGS